MLGVSGCRGLVGSSLTPEVASRYAGCFGGWLHAHSSREAQTGKPAPIVVLARDGRAGGEMIRLAALSGLLASGCRVIDLGVAMTPTVGVMVDELGADGGMVLTASHNPQEWNGLKAILRSSPNQFGVGGSAPDAKQAAEIVELFKNGSPRVVPWNQISAVEHDHDAAERHVAKVLSALNKIIFIEDIRACHFRVAIDSVNSSGRVGASLLLDELGCEVAHMGDQPTGLFEHPPEPTRENLGQLATLVREHGAHVGFAQDPDGDRLAIIDHTGHYIGEEYTLVLAAMAVLGLDGATAGAISTGNHHAASVCTNLSTSRMIDDVAWSRGATVFRTAVGEANVVSAMRQHNSPIGGEGNGGVIWPAVTYVRDSLSSMALTLALMAGSAHRRQMTIADIVHQSPTYAIEKRKVDLASKEAAKPAVEALSKAYGGEKLDRQDGVRIDFESRKAWLHVRASNTEPIMRLIAEAPTADAAKALLEEASKIIAKG